MRQLVSFYILIHSVILWMSIKSYEASNNICEGECCDGYRWDIKGTRCIECDVGFYGANCSKQCPPPSYGQNCQNNCNENCENCDHVSGCEVRSTTTRRTTVDHNVTTETLRPSGTKWVGSISSNGGNKTKTMFYPKSVPPSSGGSNQGLYAIVSVNSLLTLPVTVAVILFLCRKFYKKKPNTNIEEPGNVDIDPCYNDLNEFNTCVKTSEYDALSNCTEDTSTILSTANYLSRDAPQRKARENSYVPVREKKPKENDETLTNQDIYSKIVRNNVVVETGYHSMDGSIEIKSLECQDSVNALHRSEESLYIMPLVPTNEEPGIRIKSTVEMTSYRHHDGEVEDNRKDGEIYVTVV